MENRKEVVYCETQEQWNMVNDSLPEDIRLLHKSFENYKFRCKDLWTSSGTRSSIYYKERGYIIYTFNEWIIINNPNIKKEDMSYLINILKQYNIT